MHFLTVLAAGLIYSERDGNMPIEVYAFSHNSDIVAESASGGAFSAIAEAFFSINPDLPKVVYAVTLNEAMDVVYESAYTLEECWKFKNSKYVRSSLQGIPEAVGSELQAGKAVLFVGTPCFVYALKQKLGKLSVLTDNLICVDLICHGTPEEKYWKAYKQWLETQNKSRLRAFRFRTHLPGRSPYTAIAVFENGKKLVGTLETSLFNRMFLRHYSLAAGCFSCRFANLDRQGDLTIGDFWGIENVMPDFPSENPVSEILVNTEKGMQIMQWVRRCSQWKMQQCLTADYVQYQNNLQKPADKPADYEVFRQDFDRKGFTYVAKNYVGYDLLHRVKHRICNR